LIEIDSDPSNAQLVLVPVLRNMLFLFFFFFFSGGVCNIVAPKKSCAGAVAVFCSFLCSREIFPNSFLFRCGSLGNPQSYKVVISAVPSLKRLLLAVFSPPPSRQSPWRVSFLESSSSYSISTPDRQSFGLPPCTSLYATRLPSNLDQERVNRYPPPVLLFSAFDMSFFRSFSHCGLTPYFIRNGGLTPPFCHPSQVRSGASFDPAINLDVFEVFLRVEELWFLVLGFKDPSWVLFLKHLRV